MITLCTEKALLIPCPLMTLLRVLNCLRYILTIEKALVNNIIEMETKELTETNIDFVVADENLG